jgi:hypothetical protein
MWSEEKKVYMPSSITPSSSLYQRDFERQSGTIYIGNEGRCFTHEIDDGDGRGESRKGTNLNGILHRHHVFNSDIPCIILILGTAIGRFCFQLLWWWLW